MIRENLIIKGNNLLTSHQADPESKKGQDTDTNL